MAELNRSTGEPGPYRFDGHGINAGDEYATRLLTFAKMHKDDGGGYVLDADGRRAVGELMAAAPEMRKLLHRAADSLEDYASERGQNGSPTAAEIRALLARLTGPRPVDVD